MAERTSRKRRDFRDSRAVLASPTQPEVELNHMSPSDDTAQVKTLRGLIHNILGATRRLGEHRKDG